MKPVTNHLTHAVLRLLALLSITLEERGNFVYLVSKERELKNFDQTNSKGM